MQAEMDAMTLACLADTRGTCVVEAGEDVVCRVELDIDISNIVNCRPCDGLLEPEAAPDIDPDSVSQRHFVAPLRRASNQFSRNQLLTHPYFHQPPLAPAEANRPLPRRMRRC